MGARSTSTVVEVAMCIDARTQRKWGVADANLRPDREAVLPATEKRVIPAVSAC